MDSTFFSDGARQALLAWARDRELPSARLERILDGIGPGGARTGVPAPGQSPTVFFEGLRAMPVWSRSEFAWARPIEAAAGRIRNEYDSLRRQDASAPPAESIRTEGGSWRVHYITCVGRYDVRAEHRFPDTVAALRHAPGALSCGMTYFSTVSPKAHILPHSGFTNAHLRCHLTLSTADGCRIRVGPAVETWVEGQLLVFDDTYEHEVWNDSPQARVVLLFDVFHPDLAAHECEALEFLAGVWRRSVMTRGLTAGRLAA